MGNILADTLGIYWIPVKDGDPRLYEVFRRHYSFHQYTDDRRSNPGYRNRRLIMGPGEKLPLLGSDLKAIFGWRKFIDQSGQTGINCAFFRNEGDKLSSVLIRAAEVLAWSRWPGERLYTYVSPGKIRSTNPGYSFQCAGWVKMKERTGSGLIILEKYPE